MTMHKIVQIRVLKNFRPTNIDKNTGYETIEVIATDSDGNYFEFTFFGNEIDLVCLPAGVKE